MIALAMVRPPWHSRIDPGGLYEKLGIHSGTVAKLLELDEDIGLLQARIAGLLRDMGDAEPPPWGAAVESLNTLVMAAQKGEGVEEALAEHARIVRTGADAAQNAERLWERVQKTVELKAKVAHAEWKRQCDLRVVLPAAEVMNLVSGLLAAVEDCVLDSLGNRDLYRRICQRAIYYLPAEARQYAAGTVIDNAPRDFK
jgi:hypothetical protein